MPEPRLDDFTARVVSDPSQPQQTLLLQGFLGASSEPDHTRIYSDVTLESYIDVANADIIHSETLPKEQSPMGGSYIWVKKSAEAFLGVVGPGRTKAKFLEGPIAAEADSFSGGAAASPVAQLPKTVQLLACHPTILVKFCPPPPTKQFICPFTVAQPICHQSVLLTQCPPQTVFQPHCFPVPTPPIPWQPGEFGVAAAPPIPPSQTTPQCQSIAVAACPTLVGPICNPSLACPTPKHQCPSVAGFHCPSVQGFQCPSVAGFHCPSVQGFQCPSVAGFHCPSVAGFHCPSVAGFHCPVTHNPQCPPPTDVCTDVGPHCNPTPNPVHCPTPNMICPHPTSHCPSVGDICATSSPLFCPTWFGWPNGPC